MNIPILCNKLPLALSASFISGGRCVFGQLPFGASIITTRHRDRYRQMLYNPIINEFRGCLALISNFEGPNQIVGSESNLRDQDQNFQK